MKRIWTITGRSGSYSDYHEWIVVQYFNVAHAMKHLKKVIKRHNSLCLISRKIDAVDFYTNYMNEFDTEKTFSADNEYAIHESVVYENPEEWLKNNIDA